MARSTDPRVANMDQEIELPRKNGELVFEAPWEARAFGLAVALNEGGAYPWHDFSRALAEVIAAAEQRGDASSYYERWLASLEKLVIARGLVSETELEAYVADQVLHDDHEHEHDHSHDHAHDPSHNGHVC